jgi:hypothetical protein
MNLRTQDHEVPTLRWLSGTHRMRLQCVRIAFPNAQVPTLALLPQRNTHAHAKQSAKQFTCGKPCELQRYAPPLPTEGSSSVCPPLRFPQSDSLALGLAVCIATAQCCTDAGGLGGDCWWAADCQLHSLCSIFRSRKRHRGRSFRGGLLRRDFWKRSGRRTGARVLFCGKQREGY